MKDSKKAKNPFERLQKYYDINPFYVNLKALGVIQKDPCNHKKRLRNAEIEFSLLSSPQIKDGFKIQEQICAFCGKTLQLSIVKPKEPQRLVK